MATLAMGVVGGNIAWPLVVVGIFFGIALIMMGASSPMLVAVGMYLPFETTSAIFVGGLLRSLANWVAKRRGFNEAQKARVENAGVLTASGLIAGESSWDCFGRDCNSRRRGRDLKYSIILPM